MGAGMKRAVLAALYSRGPWFVTGDFKNADTSERHKYMLTGGDVAEVYDSVLRGRDPKASPALEHRCSDRALQLLRKSNLIEYTGTPKRWRVTGGGEA